MSTRLWCDSYIYCLMNKYKCILYLNISTKYVEFVGHELVFRSENELKCRVILFKRINSYTISLLNEFNGSCAWHFSLIDESCLYLQELSLVNMNTTCSDFSYTGSTQNLFITYLCFQETKKWVTQRKYWKHRPV